MNSNFFADLIRCDICAHGIDHHGGAGCAIAHCRCVHTRDSIIAMSIESAKQEQLSAYNAYRIGRDAASDPKDSSQE